MFFIKFKDTLAQVKKRVLFSSFNRAGRSESDASRMLRCCSRGITHILKMKNLEHEFPFFTTVYKISYEDAPFSALTETPY